MKRVLASLLLLLVLGYAFNAARVGLANTAYFQARFLLDKWQQQPQAITQSNYQQAYDFASRSVLLAPNNPHYQITKAKIVLWGYHAGFSQDAQIVDLEKLYQTAISQRPQWPEAYADYAWYLSAIKDDFPQAMLNLNQAVKYGPFHGDSLETVLKVSFSRWQQLTPQQKADFYPLIPRALQSNSRNNVLMMVKQYKKEFVVCYYLKRQGHLPQNLWSSVERQLCLAN